MQIRVNKERAVASLAAFLQQRGYVVVRTGILTLLASPTPTSRSTHSLQLELGRDIAAWEHECRLGGARILIEPPVSCTDEPEPF
jgi:hypothetical protein